MEVDHIFPRAPLSNMGMPDVVNHIGNYRLVVMPINRRKLARMPDLQTAFFGRSCTSVETTYLACLAQVAAKGNVLGHPEFLAFRDARTTLIRETASEFLGVPLG